MFYQVSEMHLIKIEPKALAKKPRYFYQRMFGILLLIIFAIEIQCAIEDSEDRNSYTNDEPLLRRDSNNNEVKYGWRLVILPSPTAAKILVKRIDEVLNLTCIAEYFDDGRTNITSDLKSNQLFKLTWHLPIMPQNSKNRVSYFDTTNSKTLMVDHLKDTDAGEYECQAKAISDTEYSPAFTESVSISVKPKKGSCSDSSFQCSTGECIPRRFVCDGVGDCKDKSDEEYHQCGHFDPCEGKLKCDDHRCIPISYCCDRIVDRNCTVNNKPPCCRQLSEIQDSTRYLQQPHLNTQNHMGTIQTTIYTIVGCAMAFMFIITIMVIAICRVHLKRTVLAHPQLRSHSAPQDSFGNIFFNTPGGLPYTSAASGLLVTYNINNGVQFMGRPMNPPPYSELVRIPPRETGPPPPYCSVENLTSDLLMPSDNPNPGQHSNHTNSSSTPVGHSNNGSSSSHNISHPSSSSSPCSERQPTRSVRGRDPQSQALDSDTEGQAEPLLEQGVNSNSNSSNNAPPESPAATPLPLVVPAAVIDESSSL